MIDVGKLPGIEIRFATLKDIDFVARAIIEASKGGTGIFPFERIFGIPENEFNTIFKKILKEDFPGSEYYCGHYVLFIYKNKPLYGFTIWEEGFTGQSSNMIKGLLLSHFIGKDRWENGLPILEEISEIELERRKGAIQIESVYKDFKIYNWFLDELYLNNQIPKTGNARKPRLNFFGYLLNNALEKMSKNNPLPELIQTSAIARNIAICKTFERNNFKCIGRCTSRFNEIKKYFPDAEMLYYEKNIKNLS